MWALDFGDETIKVAFYTNGHIESLQEIPTTITYLSGNNYCVGTKAEASAPQYNHLRTLRHIKSIIDAIYYWGTKRPLHHPSLNWRYTFDRTLQPDSPEASEDVANICEDKWGRVYKDHKIKRSLPRFRIYDDPTKQLCVFNKFVKHTATFREYSLIEVLSHMLASIKATVMSKFSGDESTILLSTRSSNNPLWDATLRLALERARIAVSQRYIPSFSLISHYLVDSRARQSKPAKVIAAFDYGTTALDVTIASCRVDPCGNYVSEVIRELPGPTAGTNTFHKLLHDFLMLEAEEVGTWEGVRSPLDYWIRENEMFQAAKHALVKLAGHTGTAIPVRDVVGGIYVNRERMLNLNHKAISEGYALIGRARELIRRHCDDDEEVTILISGRAAQLWWFKAAMIASFAKNGSKCLLAEDPNAVVSSMALLNGEKRARWRSLLKPMAFDPLKRPEDNQFDYIWAVPTTDSWTETNSPLDAHEQAREPRKRNARLDWQGKTNSPDSPRDADEQAEEHRKLNARLDWLRQGAKNLPYAPRDAHEQAREPPKRNARDDWLRQGAKNLPDAPRDAHEQAREPRKRNAREAWLRQPKPNSPYSPGDYLDFSLDP